MAGAMATGKDGIALTQEAFVSNFGGFGDIFVAVCLLFFAFSTILGWHFFGEINVRYLFGKKACKVYSVIVAGFIIVGSTLKVDLVWELADFFNGLMVIPNALALLALSGVAAYSFLDGVRFGNNRDLDAYLRGEARRAEYRPLTPGDREEEYRMLRLRLAEGISLPEYRRLFGRDLIEGREELVDRLVQQGLAVTDGQRLRLTDAGMYVSNAVILALDPDSDAGN